MTDAPDLVDQILALDPGHRDIAAFSTPGATVLGRALRRLGARVRYLTDRTSVPLVEAALKTLDEPSDVIVFPGGREAGRRVLMSEKPTHLVAIERPGRNRAGDYLNMRGVSVAAWNPPLDDFFVNRSKGRPVTIGIGDGGNEIGMGSVRARIAKLDALRARIATVIRVDHLVVAGVSNWGAYGVVAALSRLTGEDLLPTPELERRLIAACVAAGACDGVTRRREPTVDSLAADTHAAVVHLLRLASRSGIMGASMPKKGSRR